TTRNVCDHCRRRSKSELRAQDGRAIKGFAEFRDSGSGGSSTGPDSVDIDRWVPDTDSAAAHTWHPTMSDISSVSNHEPNSIFTTDQFRPTSASYMYLIPTCLEIFLQNLYPIMPLVNMPTLQASINRPLEMHEQNLLYSLCAITSNHMSGKSIKYSGLHHAEELCRRRTFGFYVTERSFAILRHKPLTFSRTPALPSTLHEYGSPEIHAKFMHLVHSYHLLDSNFVDSWNETSEAPTSINTYVYNTPTTTKSTSSISFVPYYHSESRYSRYQTMASSNPLAIFDAPRPPFFRRSRRKHDVSISFEDRPFTTECCILTANCKYRSSWNGNFRGGFRDWELDGRRYASLWTTDTHEIYCTCQDPFDMFVRTLSLTPNSQRHYAELLLAKVAEKPEIHRFSHILTNGLSISIVPGANRLNLNTSRHLGERLWRGSIVGEIKDGEDAIYKAKEEEEGYGQTNKSLME
ncbi:hypothetical protein DSL72_004155, partial [Monilinia vaccinii-corymbosi]